MAIFFDPRGVRVAFECPSSISKLGNERCWFKMWVRR